MKYLKKITNGIIIILIALMHSKLFFSSAGFGKQFLSFAESKFFQISEGMGELPATAGKTDFESAAAFWFFYFGLLLIPFGLLIHSIEKEGRTLPHYFTISYLVVILLGAYMVPDSGMTVIMLPHAIYMLVRNFIKAKKHT